MLADDPIATRAVIILREAGWSGMTISDAVEVLGQPVHRFRLSDLQAVSIDDVVRDANGLRTYDIQVKRIMREMAR